MASVHSSKASKYACRGISEGEPVDHVESAGELLIKELVQKQTNTHLTLDQQLRNEKKFERGIGCVLLNEFGAGTSSLKQFEEIKQKAERVEELMVKGVSRQEALSLLSNNRNSKATPEAQANIHQLLLQPLQQSTNDPTKFGKRQEHEVALSVKPKSLETRLYQFAVSNESTKKHLYNDSKPPDHPIHQLTAMEHSLMSVADPQNAARTIRRKRRQQVEAMAEPLQVLNKPLERHESLWDQTERPQLENKQSRPSDKKITCNRQTLYTIKQGEIVQLQDKTLKNKNKDNNLVAPKTKPSGTAFISLQVAHDSPDISRKISEEEIKHIPKFKNYDRGKESKILYVKNLSRHVTESDLAAVFDQFQKACEGSIIFRLMSGKMRGQAFVTFQCKKNATTALQVLNGVILKGKPMIIHYGKQED